MRLRQLNDGTLIAPRRGKAPKCPDGYIVDAGNPFVFRMIPIECEFKTQKETQSERCKCKKLVPFCTELDKQVTGKFCKGCQDESV